MKKVILSALAFVLFAMAANGQKIYTKSIYKKRISEERTIQSITVATGVNAFVYRVDRASDSGVVLCSKDEDLKCFECSISGGEMTVRYTEEYLRSEDKILARKMDKYIEIYTDSFEKIKVTSSAEIVVEHRFDVDDLEVSASSSGDITFRRPLTANGDVKVGATSSGDIIFEDVTAINDMMIRATSSAEVFVDKSNVYGRLIINGSSSSSVNIDHLMLIDDLKVNISSSSKVNIGELAVEEGSVMLAASSSANLIIQEGEVINNKEYSTISTTSGGGIDCVGVDVGKIKLSASSGSVVKASANTNLHIVGVSSGASVRYKHIFGAEVTGLNNVSSGGKVRKL